MEEFRVIEKLKPGGQKEVYFIEHPNYGKCILKRGRCSSSNSLERIKREVNILREVDSYYFPKNYEANFFNNGEFIIFEENIESIPLSEMKHTFIGQENKALKLFLSLIEGLRILWDRRIIHRDLKPDNILIKEDGQPVIIDLGIARILDDESLTLTIQQNGPCTPVYASPEQLRNSKCSIDMRTDFFALAIIISELVLGKHPFAPEVVGEGMGILDNLINGKYKLEFSGVRLSNGLEKIVKKLLQIEPYQRIRSYEKLEEELTKLLAR